MATSQTLVKTTSPDLLNALIGFCTEYASPPLVDSEHVLDGFGCNRTLPSDGNDFVVVTPISQTREGTNIPLFPAGEDQQELREYVAVDVQIDCYSANNFDAMDRAQTYETVTRSDVGVAFFKRFDIDCQYSDSSRNISAVLDDDRYVSRWTLVIRLGYWKSVKVTQQFFNSVNIGLKEADVHFKPKD